MPVQLIRCISSLSHRHQRMNARNRLALFLQRNLRQNACFNYETLTVSAAASDIFVTNLHIGDREWGGQSEESLTDAQERAAEAALNDLIRFDDSEAALRIYLNIGRRLHITQFDVCRNQMRDVKQRLKNIQHLTQERRSELQKVIGRFYQTIDQTEWKLLTAGMID